MVSSEMAVPPSTIPKIVPVIEINQQNINRIWPYLMIAIRKAQLIAIDLELSGLGNHPCSSKSCFSDRYTNVMNAAETRTIFSLGIATFELRRVSKNNKKLRYKCQVFNILTLEEAPFVMEPDSLCFLAAHGFDFNHLLSHAIRYTRKKPGPLHSLWEEILASGVSISMHNGLVDLAFIHNHFYMPLPQSEEVFLANVSDWFSPFAAAQLWDSKYLAEYKARFPASFLEYVFRKCQRINYQGSCEQKTHLVIKFSRLEKYFEDGKDDTLVVEDVNCEIKTDLKTSKEVCKNYQNFGYCKKRHVANGCTLSHDVDLVLDLEEIKSMKQKLSRQRRQRKRHFDDHQEELNAKKLLADSPEIATLRAENGHSTESESKTQEFSIKGHLDKFKKWVEFTFFSSKKVRQVNYLMLIPQDTKTHEKLDGTGSHRSGMDAFMTGFSVLFMQCEHLFNCGKLEISLANKLSLPGKDFPLVLKKSAFAPAQSERHLQNWARISSRRPILDNYKKVNVQILVVFNILLVFV
uniref:C3H1-type domain-containing protein n=1 Tax=Ditylenchus dipsaci TaxID=166011 RepID=A0A915EN51_9BILA